MTPILATPGTHPSGDPIAPAEVTPPDEVTVHTPKGAITVAWEMGTAVSVHGLAVFFIEFLHVTGLWKALRDRCPLKRTSNNAPDQATVVGSMLLAVLSGGNRYRHIDSLRGDGVTPDLLGMDRILSPDALLRAVRAISDHPEGQAWLQDLLLESLLPVVRKGPWILDLDSTVVTVYGKQGGSAKGYNPTKPGRPSYSYHALIIGGLRLPLDIEARPGNDSHGVYTAEQVWRLLDHRLPADAQPWCIRGDISYGNETIITGCEMRKRDFLFKLRKSEGIKAILNEMDSGDITWSDAGQGWEGREVMVRLSTWSGQRRVIILRRPAKTDGSTPKLSHQQTIFVAELCPDDAYEYAVLVTSLKHPVPTIAQFYRDRGRLREHLRRSQERLVVGRIHHPAPGAQSTHGPARSLGLHLVEHLRSPTVANGTFGVVRKGHSSTRSGVQVRGEIWREWRTPHSCAADVPGRAVFPSKPIASRPSASGIAMVTIRSSISARASTGMTPQATRRSCRLRKVFVNFQFTF